jgi:hypothetical protein
MMLQNNSQRNHQLISSSRPKTLKKKRYKPSKDLEQLGNAVEVFSLVDESQKYMVDLFPDESAEAEELAVDAVEHRLQKVTLSWVLAVEQV